MPAVFTSNHWHRETREKVCVMCHETLSLADFYSYPYTTIPLKHGGKHVIENLQIRTATENMKKGARLPRPAITQESEDA